MAKMTRRGLAGLLAAGAGAGRLEAFQGRRAVGGKIRITDLRCAIIGGSPVVRVVTDQGISGYGQA